LATRCVPSKFLPAATNPSTLIADARAGHAALLKNAIQRELPILEAPWMATPGVEEKPWQFMPDMDLLDMMMRRRNGLQVCRELRETTPTTGIPIGPSQPRAPRGKAKPRRSRRPAPAISSQNHFPTTGFPSAFAFNRGAKKKKEK